MDIIEEKMQFIETFMLILIKFIAIDRKLNNYIHNSFINDILILAFQTLRSIELRARHDNNDIGISPLKGFLSVYDNVLELNVSYC